MLITVLTQPQRRRQGPNKLFLKFPPQLVVFFLLLACICEKKTRTCVYIHITQHYTHAHLYPHTGWTLERRRCRRRLRAYMHMGLMDATV